MTDAVARISPENIAAALKGYYSPPKSGKALVEGDALLEMLRVLPSLSTEENVNPILVEVQRHHRGVSFRPEDYALIAFVDDSVTQILRQTDLDFRIESFVRDLAPYMALVAMQQGPRALTSPQPVLTLIDLLVRECIGWSEDLGILGDQFMAKIDAMLRPCITGKSSIEECYKELEAFFGKEKPLYKKMEERLCESELTVLAGQKAKFSSAELLNKLMAGKRLPIFIIFMLQGSWFEFLQSVFMSYGQKSKEWQNAAKLTEALIWSLRVQKDKAKQRSLMASLPGQISSFCASMKFDTSQVEACLGDVEEEYSQIMAGTPSDPCDFQLMGTDASMAEGSTQIDTGTMKMIEGLEEGQWFIYDDPKEPDEKVARLKLILNWQDTERLLFTNHNRRKVLHMGYGELAGHLLGKSVKMLTPRQDASHIIGSHLTTVIQGVQQQKKKEVATKEVTERKIISQQYLKTRKEALARSLDQHRKQAEAKRKRAEVLRHKAAQKLEAAIKAVESLKVNAWVKLPVMEGTLTPCRLVAIIPGNENYIFANRSGIKVGEYTKAQLSNMIVTENSEILDTGAEFENVLASVVIGLREDKNKSYEELSGDVA